MSRRLVVLPPNMFERRERTTLDLMLKLRECNFVEGVYDKANKERVFTRDGKPEIRVNGIAGVIKYGDNQWSYDRYEDFVKKFRGSVAPALVEC